MTDLKRQDAYSWLSEVSSVPLQQALRHLEKAFLNFFEGRAKYPTFKKKRHQQSATYNPGVIIADPVHAPNGQLVGIIAASFSLVKLSDPLEAVVNAQQIQAASS